MSKKIGVDLDGVVTDVVDSVIKYLSKTSKGTYYPPDFTHYEVHKWANVSREEMEEHFSKISTYRKMPFMHEAKEGLLSLSRFGYELYAVTSRPTSVQKFTNKWVFDNRLPFLDVIFSNSSEKANIAKKMGLSYFIEDKLDTCVDLANICKKIYLLDAKYNSSNGVPKNIVRVYCWSDIVRELAKELW